MNPTISDLLKSLHTAEIDAINGYEEARIHAEGRAMTPLIQELIVAHTRNAADLAGELGARQEPVDNEGSIMSAVHRTIMDVRALFGGLDEGLLPGLIDGERRNVQHYAKVIETSEPTPSVQTLLSNNRSRLEGVIARMQDLASRPPTTEPVGSAK